MINGKEQTCLIIPTDINQLKRGRQGNWLSVFRLIEESPNEQMISHRVGLVYRDNNEADKAKIMGYFKKTHCVGRVRVMDCTPSKKIDRTNNSTDIRCDGILVLTDIPSSCLSRNGENNKRYVSNVVFKSLTDKNTIYTGTLCVDDIPQHCIVTDLDTGKKSISTRFVKLPTLDTYMNTHQLVVVTNGGEIEIGRFKEWSKTEKTLNAPIQETQREEVQDTTVTPRPIPESIDGIRF